MTESNESSGNRFDRLDATAKVVTSALTHNNCRHGFIGGYAVSLVGGLRITDDVDLLVDADPANIRELLLQVSGFQLTRANNLVFMRGKDVVKVEILRGGNTRQMKLPDANTVPLHYSSLRNVHDSDTGIPIVHPSVLVLTKLKRWAPIAESTRPKSVIKARGDFEDITAILDWLVGNNLRIDFTAYPEKPKEELLPYFRKLYEIHSESRSLLQATMKAPHPQLDSWEIVRQSRTTHSAIVRYFSAIEPQSHDFIP
ncbi:uncharacterized protein N7518_007141 [Penicillium psychrosexuale]|uniref:uncharacterized protein n=1 Tax=Penicillium psychrosexuale TaxID=1002107 RepID=UPI002544FB76|nr:uncharacterized protein N7518_007141 [Penicillium psychrosexuale]KAJ5790130.1 hypothetical protein N7518_007141 [Penicillium psychrosexuale]